MLRGTRADPPGLHVHDGGAKSMIRRKLTSPPHANNVSD